MILIFLFIFQSLSLVPAWGSACCVSQSGMPGIILGDEKGILSFSVMGSKVIADSLGPGEGTPVFRDETSPKEYRQSFVFSGSYLIDGDRLQLGGQIPLLSNQSTATNGKSFSASGIGDVSAILGYEILPEYEYSKWKPRGYTYLQWTLPTGVSVNDSSVPYSTDVTGLGFHQVNWGTVLLKVFGRIDSVLQFRVGRFFREKTSDEANTLGDAQLWALNGGFQLGYNFSDRYRFGFGVDGSFLSSYLNYQERLVWPVSLSLSAMIFESSSLAVSYVDQTLVGTTYNTALIRGLSLSYQIRFLR